MCFLSCDSGYALLIVYDPQQHKKIILFTASTISVVDTLDELQIRLPLVNARTMEQ